MNDGEKDQTKDQTAAPAAGGAAAAPAPPDAEDVVDSAALESLDEAIAAEDPDFKSGLDQMATEASSGEAQIELLDLDQLLKEQEEKSLKSRLRRLMRKFRNFITGLRTTSLHFLKNVLPLLLKKVLGAVKAGLGVLQEGLRQFGFKPRAFKLKVLGFAILCGASVATLMWVTRTALLTPKDQLFVQSLEELAEEKGEFEPQRQENLYDSVRAAQNIVVTPKLVVNIRSSPSSGPNPMLAAELYVEGNSPDVIVEIKDREVEFRDGFMRTLEEFTYDEVASPEGKQRLLERLAREANRLVTKGRVRKLYFKTIILKP
ncbi:MAG: flagellar basal body-associated FliL family protein [Bdellovibrionaceae bacterium]|nr:flagellar basal body-associated FliL family protein [Pseudobdellovibrionaceae bacterium]